MFGSHDAIPTIKWKVRLFKNVSGKWNELFLKNYATFKRIMNKKVKHLLPLRNEKIKEWNENLKTKAGLCCNQKQVFLVKGYGKPY